MFFKFTHDLVGIDRINKKISSMSSNNQTYQAKSNHNVAECN